MVAGSAAGSDKTILLMGAADDVELVSVQRALDAIGAAPVAVLDTARINDGITLTWDPDHCRGTLVIDRQHYPLDRIGAAYWRTVAYPPAPDDGSGPDRADVTPDRLDVASLVVDNSIAHLQTLHSESPFRWINSERAYRLHRTKPVQLRRVREAGIPTPRTLLTNHPDYALDFLRSLGRCIVKPVRGGDYAQLLHDTAAGRAALRDQLRWMPLTLQAHVAGRDIRTYVFGEQCHSIRIDAATVDFRLDPAQTVQRWHPPPHVHDWAVRCARLLDLDWTAIDWRLDASGQYTFLEANFSPMFSAVEHATGLPLADTLARLLLADTLAIDRGG